MTVEPPTLTVACKRLSARERADLDQLETTIEHGRDTFRKVALAILEIRDRKLYRETHKTFESYCREKWHFSTMTGHRMAQAAQVIQEREAQSLPPPINERQARIMRLQAKQVMSIDTGAEPAAHDERLPEPLYDDSHSGLAKTAAIERCLNQLRNLHAAHPWRTRADELLLLYQETVLPWPAKDLE